MKRHSVRILSASTTRAHRAFIGGSNVRGGIAAQESFKTADARRWPRDRT
jgi:hypothetical protein